MNLIFFLEEPSAKALLEGLLPRILPDYVFPQYVVFEGKQDLLKRVHIKLRGWGTPNTCFVVLFDQDIQDCGELKAKAAKICADCGKPDTLIRIACQEIESWYLGDLQSVETALEVPGIANKQRSQFGIPDEIESPKEALKRLTDNVYQQVDGSRRIGKSLALTGNLSTSFNAFISGVQRVVNQGCMN